MSLRLRSRSIVRGLPSVVAFAAAAGLAVFSSSCTKKDPGTQASTEDEILIGEVASMTGSEATFGQSTHKGSQLAVDEINAQGGIVTASGTKKLKLISIDDQGKAAEAALAVTKLATSVKVRAILGEVASSLSLAMAPIAQQNQVPMVAPSSINSRITQVGDYIFRVCFTDQFQSRAIEQFAVKDLKAKKAAVLKDSKSDYSVDSAKIFGELFVKDGGTVVIEQSYTSGDMDFKAQLTAIKAKSPDVIVIPGYYTDIGLIARQAKQVGITAPLLGGDGWDSPKLKEIGGAALDGSYFVSHFSQKDAQAQSFIRAYQKAYGGEIPDGIAALGYDAAKVLGQALAHEKQPSTGATLREALAAVQDFVGVTGRITIGPDRNAVKSAVVFKLGAGGSAIVETTIQP